MRTVPAFFLVLLSLSASYAVSQTVWTSTAPAASATDIILISTDASWSVDGGSSSGYVVSSPNFAHSPQGLVSPTNSNFTASAVFSLTGLPQNVYIDLAVDDDADLYINGTLVFTERSGVYTELYGMDVTSYLNAGMNSISVNVINAGGASGLATGIWTTSAIPEPSTYAAIFGGVALAGAVFWRRRSARQAAVHPESMA